MKLINKSLTTLACITSLTGCFNYLEGVVTEESYIAPQEITKDSAYFGNATIQQGESKYTFVLKNSQGEYCMAVMDYYSTKEAVDLFISKGDKVQIEFKLGTFPEPGSIVSIKPRHIKVLK